MTISTVLLIDLDGTLMVNPFMTAVIPLITQHVEAQTGISPDVQVDAFVNENIRRLRDTPDPSAMDWDDIIETVLRGYGTAPVEPVQTLVERYAEPPHIALLDHADAVLRALARPGRSLVVASMGLSRYQMPVLRALGLAPLFDDFLMPDLVGALKTDARFYARYTRLSPRPRLISIGDSLSDDVIAPKSFGFRSVLKLPDFQPADLPPRARPAHLPDPPPVLPDAIITTLAELPPLIDALEADA